LLIGFVVLTSVLLLSRIAAAWAQDQPRRHHRRSKHTGRVSHAHQHNPWESVSCQGSCDAMRKLQGRRFLSREAPTFPVPGCNSNKCRCRYVHHRDRRSGGDRRGMHGLRTALYEYVEENERRGKRGRRSSDLAMA
jgi:hypothetical protein